MAQKELMPQKRGLLSVNAILNTLFMTLMGNLFIVSLAKVSIPMYPVPLTMFTFSVLMVGVYIKPHQAVLAVAFFILEAAIGLPVTVSTMVGANILKSTTLGYIVGGMFSAGFIAYCVKHKISTTKMSAVMVMLAATSIIWLFGVAWLTYLFNFEIGFIKGWLPFVLGDMIKAVVAASILYRKLGRTAQRWRIQK